MIILMCIKILEMNSIFFFPLECQNIDSEIFTKTIVYGLSAMILWILTDVEHQKCRSLLFWDSVYVTFI